MPNVKKLHDEAALRLNPHDLEAGRKQVWQIIRPLRRFAFIYNALTGAALTLSLILIIISIALSYAIGESYYVYLIVMGSVIFFAFMTIAYFKGLRIIQNRRLFGTGAPYDLRLPPPLATLMAELRAGTLLTAIPVASGFKKPGSWQAGDLCFYEDALTSVSFENRFAPLLLAPNPRVYAALSLPQIHRLNRPIYVYSLPAPAEVETEDEPTSSNHRPEDQWLVGGDLRVFKTCLAAFIAAEIPSHSADWFRTALETARREMRKGTQWGAKNAAIAAIKAELKGVYGSESGPGGGIADSTIKDLLAGKRGRKDIKGYFSPTPPPEG